MESKICIVIFITIITCVHAGNGGIAFYVGMSENKGPYTEPTKVACDRVVTNRGQGYDPSTGEFTAPESGTYNFNVVMAASERKEAEVVLFRNDKQIGAVYAESRPFWSQSTKSMIVNLDQGDKVWLRASAGTYVMKGMMYTTFSGYMIPEKA